MKLYMTAQEVLGLDWQKNPRPLTNRGGIYRIVERATGKLIYIGQATDLGYRLAPSVHPIFRGEVHDVYILFEPDRKERRYMEGVFIQLLKPAQNHRNGTMPDVPDALLRECYERIFNR